MAWALVPNWIKQALFGAVIVVLMLIAFKVWLIRHDAETLSGYVKQSELDTANTLLQKAKNDAKFQADRADALAQQINIAADAAKQSEQRYEDAIKDDTGNDGGTVTQSDLDWVSKHR